MQSPKATKHAKGPKDPKDQKGSAGAADLRHSKESQGRKRPGVSPTPQSAKRTPSQKDSQPSRDFKDHTGGKSKHEDFRLVALRSLCKAFKVSKSFIQQKLASKVKKFSHLLKNDPKNEKFSKSFQKFEKKLQTIKSLDSPAVKAAAFIYAQFDLKLNFDSVTDRVQELLGRDVDGLVKEVFAQVGQEGGPKSNYLKLYEHVKEKPQKKFKEAKEKIQKLIGLVQHKKESRKIKKKSREQRKLGARNEGDDEEEGEDETQGKKDKAGDREESELSAVEGAKETRDPINLKMKTKLAGELDKIIQKSTFFPRDREKPDPRPPRKDFPHKNDRRKRIEKRGQTHNGGKADPRFTPSQPDPGFHPSYAAKLAARTSQKAQKFGGEVVEL